MTLMQSLQQLRLSRTGRPRKRLPKGPLYTLVNIGSTLAQQPLGKDTGRLDIDRIVQKDQGLLRSFRSHPLGRTLLPGRRVEGEQARMEKSATPVGIKTPAIERLS